ncbi:MAG: hypothetical protein Q4D61_01330 [Cardiobacteriaceae bacterium]|nr:hypothetical protein [Cardiobacteriaceae bacterium]
MNPFARPRPRILLLGARAPACLEWARFLARHGCAVFAADSVAPTLTAYSNAVVRDFPLPPPAERFADWQAALARIVAAHRIVAVIPTCEEALYLAQSDALADKRWCSALPLMDALHHKYRFSQMCAAWGIAAPATFRVDNAADWLGRSRDYVFKPVYSRFASRTLIRPDAALLAKALGEGGDWIAQDVAEGEEICSFSLFVDGELRAHTAYRAQYRTSHASVDFTPVADAAIYRFAEAFGRATGYSGQAGFDFIRTREGLRALECNPRATSGIHLLAGANEALWQALADPARPAVHISHGRRAQLSLPVLLAAKDRLLRRDFWQDFRRGRDVIFDARDPLPALAQPRLLLAQMARAHTERLPLAAATTRDIAYHGLAQPRFFAASDLADNALSPAARYVRNDPVAAIENVRAELKLWQGASLALPVSISHTQQAEQSYVASPLNHYGAYALAESARHLAPRAQQRLQPPLQALIRALRHARLDDVVIANNWLLSTNLYPACPPPDTLRQLVNDCRAHYPRHAVLFRSLSPALHADWIAALESLGAIAIASRRVYLLDARDTPPVPSRDIRNDLALQAKSPFTRASVAEADYPRIADLYAMLYRDKYSRHNPALGAQWIAAQHQSGLLHLNVLRDGARIVGATGTMQMASADTFTTPLFGYDTAYPQKAGLYRLLSLQLWQETAQQKKLRHQSAGAADFKRQRGATPATEYNLVFIRHLPLRQQLAWQTLRAIVNSLALPFMIDREL